MRFVKTEELVKGMRLAKPIYNKNGVLLYDRDTKLTKQGINSIKNFGIIGIYILETIEPLPPMTEEDIEFERFQTMSVFGLKEDMELLMLGKKPVNIENLIKILVKNYCKKDKKVNFMQNIRSTEDYVYKHCLNVAIMVSMMGARLKISNEDMRYIIYAALIHDIGELIVGNDEDADELNKTGGKRNEVLTRYAQKGIKLLLDNVNIPSRVMDILNHRLRVLQNIKVEDIPEDIAMAASILQVAEIYDDITAMKIGEEPASEVVAVRYLLGESENLGSRVVGALIDSLKILFPGICVELTNKMTGLVIKGNDDDVLRPIVLGFTDNIVYNLYDDKLYKVVQIKDIMKSMDKRVHIDKATIDEYMKMYN